MSGTGPLRTVEWATLDSASRSGLLARPAPESGAELTARVSAILREVRAGGDSALRALTRRYDGIDLVSPWVPASEIAAAQARLPAPLRDALRTAVETVTCFHRTALPQNQSVATAPGVTCESRWLPLDPVALYVPAGSAPLPSTAIMLAVPARLAGCRHIILATPPDRNGQADPAVLAVAALLGIEQVLLAGGVQAIAALAYGTASIPAVVKLFGPGNRFVAEAKRLAAQDPAAAAMDLPAGPSELMVIADHAARPAWVAADLLSQAEHGADSQVFLLTDDPTLPDRVNQALTEALSTLPRAALAGQALATGAMIVVPDLATATTIANRYAPEHLALATDRADAILGEIRCAGSVFVGHHTPEALGDYISGTNHVLPTGGWARSCSGLSVTDFMRRMTIQQASADGLARLGPAGACIAAHEGLEAHRRAIAVRLEHHASA